MVNCFFLKAKANYRYIDSETQGIHQPQQKVSGLSIDMQGGDGAYGDGAASLLEWCFSL